MAGQLSLPWRKEQVKSAGTRGHLEEGKERMVPSLILARASLWLDLASFLVLLRTKHVLL